MPSIFPRLDPNLVITTGVEGPTALKAIEAIKNEIVQRLGQIGVGKHIQAEVLAKLNDGSYIAKIDGIAMRLALPMTTQIGQKLSLTLLQLVPRTIFLLDGKSQVNLLDPPRKSNSIEALQIKSAFADESSMQLSKSISGEANLSTFSAQDTTLQSPKQLTTSQLNAPQYLSANQRFANQYLASEPIEQSSQTDLSPTGQLINALLQETKNPQEKSNIKVLAPLLETDKNFIPEKQIAKHIESHLHQSISSSGLFYESHVTQWLLGQKSRTEIELEPQAKIAVELEQSVLVNKEESHHSALAQIIHQQLDILEQQRLTWSGLLAPNMPLEWEVNEQPQQETSSENNSETIQSWLSHLRIHLPQLGLVDIQLQLRDNQVQLAIQAEHQDSSEFLKAAYPSLERSIETSGAHIQSFSVKHEERD
jgi:flagellar hook-length control protein FliK